MSDEPISQIPTAAPSLQPTFTPTYGPTLPSRQIFDEIWIIHTIIEYELQNDTVYEYLDLIRDISFNWLKSIAYNNTNSYCILDYSDSIDDVTDFSFKYQFEMSICREQTAISLVDLYNNKSAESLNDQLANSNETESLIISIHMSTTLISPHISTTVLPIETTDADKTNQKHQDHLPLFGVITVSISAFLIIVCCLALCIRNRYSISSKIEIQIKNKDLGVQLLSIENDEQSKVKTESIAEAISAPSGLYKAPTIPPGSPNHKNEDVSNYVAVQYAITSGQVPAPINEGQRKSKTSSMTVGSEGLYVQSKSLSSVHTVDGDIITTTGLPIAISESVDLKNVSLQKMVTPFEYNLDSLEDAIEEADNESDLNSTRGSACK